MYPARAEVLHRNSQGGLAYEQANSPAEFYVRTDPRRNNAIRGWLNAHGRILATLPVGVIAMMQRGGPTTLPLDDREIGGALFSGVSAFLQVDLVNPKYTLTSYFAPPYPDAVALDGEPFSVVGPLGENKGYFLELLGADQQLAGRYNFQEDTGTAENLIINYAQQANGGEQPYFVFESVDHGYGYRLRITQRGVTEDSVGNFDRHFEALRNLTERIGRALYLAHGLNIPKRTFVMQPPDDTEGSAAKLEAEIDEYATKSGRRRSEDGFRPTNPYL